MKDYIVNFVLKREEDSKKFRGQVWKSNYVSGGYFVSTSRDLCPGSTHERFKEFEKLSDAFEFLAEQQRLFEEHNMEG